MQDLEEYLIRCSNNESFCCYGSDFLIKSYMIENPLEMGRCLSKENEDDKEMKRSYTKTFGSKKLQTISEENADGRDFPESIVHSNEVPAFTTNDNSSIDTGKQQYNDTVNTRAKNYKEEVEEILNHVSNTDKTPRQKSHSNVLGNAPYPPILKDNQSVDSKNERTVLNCGIIDRNNKHTKSDHINEVTEYKKETKEEGVNNYKPNLSYACVTKNKTASEIARSQISELSASDLVTTISYSLNCEQKPVNSGSYFKPELNNKLDSKEMNVNGSLVSPDNDYVNTIDRQIEAEIAEGIKNIKIETEIEIFPNNIEETVQSTGPVETNTIDTTNILNEAMALIATIQQFWGPLIEIPKLKSDAEILLKLLYECQNIDNTDTSIANAIKKVIKHQELLEERIPIIQTHESENNNPIKEETLYYSEESKEIMKISSQIISLYKKAIKEEWTKIQVKEQLKKCVNDLEKINVQTEDTVANELKDNIIYFCNDLYDNQRIEFNFTANEQCGTLV